MTLFKSSEIQDSQEDPEGGEGPISKVLKTLDQSVEHKKAVKKKAQQISSLAQSGSFRIPVLDPEKA